MKKLLVLLLLSGCVPFQEIASNQCRSYGFPPGSRDFAYCMERAHQEQAYRTQFKPIPYLPVQQPSFSRPVVMGQCVTTNDAFGNRTNCY